MAVAASTTLLSAPADELAGWRAHGDMLVPVASSADECHLLDVNGKSGGTDLAQGLHPRLPATASANARTAYLSRPADSSSTRQPLEETRSTNSLERLNKEIKRRTDFVGVFPISAAKLRLAGAFLVQTHHEWQVSERRYLSEGFIVSAPGPDPNEVACTSPIHGIVKTSQPPGYRVKIIYTTPLDAAATALRTRHLRVSFGPRTTNPEPDDMRRPPAWPT